MLQKREVIVVILLSLVTCGIYPLYWSYVTMQALDEEGQSSNMPFIAQFLLLFFYVGYIVFALNANSNINAVRERRGLIAKDNTVLYVILAVFCPIALIAVVQSEINAIVDAKSF